MLLLPICVGIAILVICLIYKCYSGLTLTDSNPTISSEATAAKQDARSTKTSTDWYDISMFKWSVKRVLDAEMLSDTEIHESLLILKKQHAHKRHLKGLLDPQTFNARFIKNPANIMESPLDTFVQILYTGRSHWITVTNFKCHSNRAVKIYDSLYNESNYNNNQVLSNFFKRLYRHSSSPHESITCEIEPVQVQSDLSSCGLFAIAFAVDLCAEFQNPSCQFYNEEKMRKHLFQCLRSQHFTEFPKLQENANNICQRSFAKTIEIFV